MHSHLEIDKQHELGSNPKPISNITTQAINQVLKQHPRDNSMLPLSDYDKK